MPLFKKSRFLSLWNEYNFPSRNIYIHPSLNLCLLGWKTMLPSSFFKSIFWTNWTTKKAFLRFQGITGQSEGIVSAAVQGIYLVDSDRRITQSNTDYISTLLCRAEPPLLNWHGKSARYPLTKKRDVLLQLVCVPSPNKRGIGTRTLGPLQVLSYEWS